MSASAPPPLAARFRGSAPLQTLSVLPGLVFAGRKGGGAWPEVREESIYRYRFKTIIKAIIDLNPIINQVSSLMSKGVVVVSIFSRV